MHIRESKREWADCYGKVFRCNVCEWGQQVGCDTFNTFKAHHYQRHQQLQWAEGMKGSMFTKLQQKMNSRWLTGLATDERLQDRCF